MRRRRRSTRSTRRRCAQLKRKGFSDRAPRARSSAPTRTTCARARHALGVRPGLQARRHLRRRVRDATRRTCTRPTRTSTRREPTDRKKIMILGGGPNRIGQGIEFDYCCVHAAFALREDGFETIMVNCNPETVSTDYDTSDRLYFEPLTLEDVLEIVRRREAGGRDRAVRRPDAAQARARARGGRRADHRHQRRRRSTSPRTASASSSWSTSSKLQQPPNGTARTDERGASTPRERDRLPGGGAARRTCSAAGRWRSCYDAARPASATCARRWRCRNDQPVLIDHFLDDAIEVDVDALCDGERRA